jgi:hypothetical protein
VRPDPGADKGNRSPLGRGLDHAQQFKHLRLVEDDCANDQVDSPVRKKPHRLGDRLGANQIMAGEHPFQDRPGLGGRCYDDLGHATISSGSRSHRAVAQSVWREIMCGSSARHL